MGTNPVLQPGCTVRRSASRSSGPLRKGWRILRCLLPVLAALPALAHGAAAMPGVGHRTLALVAGGFTLALFLVFLWNRHLGRLNGKLARTVREVSALQAALENKTALLEGLVENSGALIYVKDLEGRYGLVNRRWEEVIGRRREEVLGLGDLEVFPGPDGGNFRGLDQEVLRQGSPLEQEEVLATPEGKVTFLTVKFPLRDAAGSVWGLCGMSTDITQLKEGEARIQQLAAELEIERDYAQARALQDALTRIPNRRHFEDTLALEFFRLKRSGAPLSLVILDVDHFKLYNDRLGHPAGDDTLRRIAQTLLGCMGRPADLAARFGGEEFAAILPDTDAAGAALIAERIRRTVEALAIPHPGGSAAPVVTVSLGHATGHPSRMVSPDELVARADAALYAAKQAGRNRAWAAPEPEPAQAIHGLIQLTWRESAESGNALVDREHRELFELSNALLAAILEGRDREGLQGAMDALLRALETHFQDEERVLREAGYPHVAAHAAIHRELLGRARELMARYEAGELPAAELFGFLAYEMAAQHMLREDRKFFPYLAR